MIETRLDDVALDYGRARLHGAVRGTLRLADGDLTSRRFSIAGSELVAERFGVTAPSGNETGWWARLRVPAADLELGPARRARGRFELALRDTRPLVAMIDQRRDLPRWMERALAFEDAQVSGRFAWRVGEFALPSFVSKREESSALGSARLRRHELGARILLTWKTLQAGVEIVGGQRRLHLRDAATWFADTAPAAAPPPQR